MGGAGSNLVFAYTCVLVEKLRSERPFYILVCRGKNKKLEEKVSLTGSLEYYLRERRQMSILQLVQRMNL